MDLCFRGVLRVGCHGEGKELARGGEFDQWKGRSRGIGQFFPFFYQALQEGCIIIEARDPKPFGLQV